MESLYGILHGLAVAIQPTHLLYTLIGVFIGTMISHLPGIGPSAGIALLIPVTFGMDPITALMMLTGIYYGCMYGGAVTAILLNTPGDAAAVMTVLDGYPMARKGVLRPRLAIAGGEFVHRRHDRRDGALVRRCPARCGGAALRPDRIFRADLLRSLDCRRAQWQFDRKRHDGGVHRAGSRDHRHRPAERRAALHHGPRTTPGPGELPGGRRRAFRDRRGQPDGGRHARWNAAFGEAWRASCGSRSKEWQRARPAIFRGYGGGLPLRRCARPGRNLAAMLSYVLEKKISKHPEEFGHGAMEGIAAPEAATNADTCGAFVHLLALGVPGSGATAVIMGAFIMYGIQPGPMLFHTQPDLVWGLIASMYIGNIMLLVLNLPLVGILSQASCMCRPGILLCVILGHSFGGCLFIQYRCLRPVPRALLRRGGLRVPQVRHA